jgi:ribosome biogenesis GTPase / thiamine phosphate phosphatase
MASSDPPRKKPKGKKVRVAFRRNRSKPPRPKDWTERARDAEDREIDSSQSESVVAKGDLSRQRTIIVGDDAAELGGDLRAGVVVAMRGLYADVDDGDRVRPCTIRRVLRTRLIEERHPVTIGDRVRFRAESGSAGTEQEGVIEAVEPRRGQLRRVSQRRVHTVVANVDHAVIVSSAAEPPPKPHLIDRYIVASLAGDITPVICMNKMDLDKGGSAGAVLDRYELLGYVTLRTSIVSGQGIDELRAVLKDSASVIAGQSGVGKSSLLNAVQPGLNLRVGVVSVQTSKGRHTTSQASLIRMPFGGYVVDTPGVRTLDISMVPRNEFETYFVEFPEHVANCRFPDCTHTHETDCAVKHAVQRGAIHPDRYESYVRLFEEMPD